MRAVANYFRDIVAAIYTITLGLGVTMKCLFSKPVTLQYPDERPEVPDGYRGIHTYEIEKCIACNLCVQICPITCITLAYEGKGKNAVIHQYDIDYTKCLFCHLCCEVCPTDCVHMGKEFDLASYTRAECVIPFAKAAAVQKQE